MVVRNLNSFPSSSLILIGVATCSFFPSFSCKKLASASYRLRPKLAFSLVYTTLPSESVIYMASTPVSSSSFSISLSSNAPFFHPIVLNYLNLFKHDILHSFSSYKLLHAKYMVSHIFCHLL